MLGRRRRWRLGDAVPISVEGEGMAKTVKLTVNGKRHTVESAPDTALLYVLRN